MPVNILMPALSPTMEKGNLSRWLKKEGDKVKPGDVIAEIETDKATMEVEAVDEGTLGKILVPEGTEDVAVNTPIAVILADGEDASAVKATVKPGVSLTVSVVNAATVPVTGLCTPGAESYGGRTISYQKTAFPSCSRHRNRTGMR